MESLTAKERLETAIRLGKPDRVPVAPMLDHFSAHYGGINQREMLYDIRKADRALGWTLDQLGMVDGLHFAWAGLGKLLDVVFPNPPLMPGNDGMPLDAAFQFVEKPVMEANEYLDIARRGAFRWFFDKLKINHPRLTSPIGLAATMGGLAVDMLKLKMSVRKWRAKGVETMVGFNMALVPMEFISLALRSFDPFLLDLFRHPDEVKAGGRALIKSFKLAGTAMVMASGIRRIFIGGTRTSASFLSPKQFEEFALPEWVELCEYFTARNVTPLLHLDSDWTAFFPFLKNLPRGKCILNLDGTSDIFKAKEILGDHICIMGDVPAALLKLGEPEEVDDYCRRLITEVGAGGGFILASGCTVPMDARPENVKAMVASVKRYKP